MLSPLSYPASVDLTNCDREPIHIPGSIQPHGLLFVLNATDFSVLQVSQNLPNFLPFTVDDVLGQSFEKILGADNMALLKQESASSRLNEAVPLTLRLEGQDYHVITHHSPEDTQLLIVELEVVSDAQAMTAFDFYHALRGSLVKYRKAPDLRQYLDQIALDLKEMTGFDRIMVYQFDADCNGEVIVEHREPHMDSYMGLHFPHKDIPRQARELYRRNTLRLIANATFDKAPLVPQQNPLTQASPDLSFSVLRSVSPIHIEYLQNMRVQASMSISLLNDVGDLWGLICLHHPEPRYVPYPIRALCELYGQMVSTQISQQEKHQTIEANIAGQEKLSRILDFSMTEIDRERALLERIAHPDSGLLELFDASGAILHTEEAEVRLGNLPVSGSAEADILSRALTEARKQLGQATNLEAAQESSGRVFATASLTTLLPEAEKIRHLVSGLLLVSLSEKHHEYIALVRPELIQLVRWAGQPERGLTMEGGQVTLHPRKSFESWQEELLGRSAPWSDADLLVAEKMRVAVVERKQLLERQRAAEALKKLNNELKASNLDLENFASIVSHDLKTPLRKITMFTMRLKEMGEPTALDERSLDYINRIENSTERMDQLISDLLAFSRVKRINVALKSIDLADVIQQARENLESDIQEAGATLNISKLPRVKADAALMVQLFQNLLSNGIKYHRPEVAPVVSVYSESSSRPDLCRIVVEDNGIGFEDKYREYIFEMFKRLHSRDEYEGTGVGLAICRRIIEHFGGTLTAESEVGKGSRFILEMPAVT